MDENNPVHPDMPFHICSISKWVTTLGVMILCERSILPLDRNVNDYLNDWKVRGIDGQEVDTVTLRHLLSHTSGVVDGEDSFTGYRDSMGHINELDILEGRFTYNQRPARGEHEPGEVFEYSDAGYVIVQKVIETVMRSDFEQIMEQLIFAPLKMEHTFYGTRTNFESREDLSSGYDSNGKPNDEKQILCPDLAAAGLWSTPYDMLILAQEFIDAMHDSGQVLPRQYISQMLSPQFTKSVGLEWVLFLNKPMDLFQKVGGGRAVHAICGLCTGICLYSDG